LSVIPIQEIEAWILAAKEMVLQELVTRKSSSKPGIPSISQIESTARPKERLDSRSQDSGETPFNKGIFMNPWVKQSVWKSSPGSVCIVSSLDFMFVALSITFMTKRPGYKCDEKNYREDFIPRI
jgi:hypothetical protein